MPTFDVGAEPLTVFEVGDEYLFAHYFDRQDVFDDLRDYYNDDAYRFEVPADEFGEVRERLEDAYFEPRVVTDLQPYCVVIEKYEEHAKILKSSVANWERKGHRFFLMKGELAVKEAIERGATPISETDFVAGI
jgi:hypothetical protein